ncbi:hypothetical protein [Streptomyces sp. ISBFB 2968]|uniref:hypothetical protein n=1 Tax=Streptomyces sp. ISBFB 2968 TaxID=2903527 RepID=UPI002FDBE46D
MSTTSPSYRAARRHQQRKRRQLQAIGKWQSPRVDAEPVRAHVRAVLSTGMSEAALEARLDLSRGRFRHLLTGTDGRPPGREVERETAEKVLAFWPTLADFPDTASIDATGTRRRAEALAVLGWSGARLAQEIGMLKDNFNTCLRAQRVSARFARKVAALYDRLWSQRPEDHGVAPSVAGWTRKRAAAAGFVGPLAWDDDTIDDPTALPQTDALAPAASDGDNLAARWLMGESVILSRAERNEVLQHLFEWTTDTTAQIAARLEMSPEAAERQWHRLQQKAAADGRRLWRRAWAYRDKDLTKNEMGAAA